MICKQEVRGSNPLGSTSQNTSVLIMDGGVRASKIDGAVQFSPIAS
jgi:hypothetical protein